MSVVVVVVVEVVWMVVVVVKITKKYIANMKHTITILMIFFSITASCQEKSKIHPDYFSVGYFGEKVFHPGLTGNISYMFFIGKDSLIKRNRLDYGLGFSGYIHPENHIGLQIKPQLAYYHLFGKTFELGLKTEIGYMRRFYQGETLEVSDNEEINNVGIAGQNALAAGIYLSIGQNFWILKSKPFRWFIESGAFWEYPYNRYSLVHPSVAIGISKIIEQCHQE